MKNKIVLFLLLVSSLAFGQVPRVFTGKCNISQTGSGAGYWQVGVTNFDSPGGVYDAGDITVNDKLYFNDSGILYTLNITTIVSASGTNATIRVSNVGVTGISSVPTSAAEISRGTANYKFVPWTANMTDNDNQIVNEHSWYLVDSLLAIQAAKGNITQGTLVAASASRTVPMNGQDLTFDNADDIRLEATGEYFIGSGSGDLPTLDSDNNGFDLGLGSSNELVLHQRVADHVLSKAGAPVNGTDIAWYVGQLLVNTVDGSVYRATAKSTNPDFSGTGSTWFMLPTGATSGVTTFESRTGTVTSAAGDYTASEVTNVPAGTISGITVQAAIDELATEKASVDSIPAHRTDINNLQVLTGRVDGSTNMGTYTGTTIPDNQSVKQNVQALETAIEGVLPKDITTFGYNPLTRVVTLGKSDGGTITGAVTEIVFTTAAPTGTPAFPVAIDTVGTDTMYVANNGAWVRFASGGGVTGSGTANYLAYWSGSSAITGSSGLTYSAPKNTITVPNAKTIAGTEQSNTTTAVEVTGGFFESAGATGAIEITLPPCFDSVGFGIQVLSFTVEINSFNKGIFQVPVFGYVDNGVFYSQSNAYVVGKSDQTPGNVRFGMEGGRHKVWVGELGTAYGTVTAHIRDVQNYRVSGTAVQLFHIATGWAIAMENTAFGTVNDTEILRHQFSDNKVVDVTGGYSHIARSKPIVAHGYNGGFTGAHEITLPPSTTALASTGVDFVITGILNVASLSNWRVFKISANYSYVSRNFSNVFVTWEGGQVSTLPFRFGDDGTNGKIWIGDLATVWAASDLALFDLRTIGVSEAVFDDFSKNWAVGLETSAFNNVDATFTPTAAGAVPYTSGAGFAYSSTLSYDGTNLTLPVGKFSDGSASAPSGTFANDTTTGFFRPTTDVFGISTGGTERVRVDASGRIGIGTTSPGSPLQVDKTGTATETLVTLNRPTAPTIGNETKLAFALAGTDVGVMSSKREASSDYSMNFFTLQSGLGNTTPGVHVGANNKVGINQDTAVYFMDVKGSSNHIRALSTSTTAIISLDNSTTGTSGGDIIQSGNNMLFSAPGYIDFSSTASSTKGVTISEEGAFFLKSYTSGEATALTAANGQLIYVNTTGGVFTTVGFWGRENGTWIKL